MDENRRILARASGWARALRADRIPVAGSWLRRMGTILNEALQADGGVDARIDDAVDLRLSARAFSGGAYAFDPRLTAELANLARPGRAFLDAGAHVGIASLVYAKLAGEATRVVAFEPNPRAYELLVENSRVNGQRLECLRMALGNMVGDAAIHCDGIDPNASLSAEAPGKYWYWEGRDKPVLTARKVTITTIDRICAAIGLEPGLIKLDVEGAEYQVLDGARATLLRLRPEVLLETHVFAWPSFGYGRADLERLLDELGYDALDGSGANVAGRLGEGPERDNNHYLLRPR